MKYIGLVIFALIVAVGCSKNSTPKAPLISPDVMAGEKVVNEKCGKCHGLKKVDDFTALEWEPIMHNMAKKARLDSVQKAQAMSYVKFYAKQS